MLIRSCIKNACQTTFKAIIKVELEDKRKQDSSKCAQKSIEQKNTNLTTMMICDREKEKARRSKEREKQHTHMVYFELRFWAELPCSTLCAHMWKQNSHTQQPSIYTRESLSLEIYVGLLLLLYCFCLLLSFIQYISLSLCIQMHPHSKLPQGNECSNFIPCRYAVFWRHKVFTRFWFAKSYHKWSSKHF